MQTTTIDHQALRQRFNPDGSQLRKHQLRMLEILVVIDKICRKHQIPYWLSSGTLIGAVRHNGFIPWDDDLDIEMMRNDYLLENPVYDKTNNIYSLWLAKERLQEDDTLLIESDLIFSDRLFPMILENPYPNLALVAKYESWMDGTMVRIDTDNNIVNFIPKQAFDYNHVDSYYKTVNIYKFSKDFLRNSYVPFLDAYTKAVAWQPSRQRAQPCAPRDLQR